MSSGNGSHLSQHLNRTPAWAPQNPWRGGLLVTAGLLRREHVRGPGRVVRRLRGPLARALRRLPRPAPVRLESTFWDENSLQYRRNAKSNLDNSRMQLGKQWYAPFRVQHTHRQFVILHDGTPHWCRLCGGLREHVDVALACSGFSADQYPGPQITPDSFAPGSFEGSSARRLVSIRW